MMLSGWGRFPRQPCRISSPRDEAELRAQVAKGGLIARGNGRAYGDSALSRTNTVDMRGFNRMISFDEATGQLVAEAGVLLADMIRAFLPRGWFPIVTPGTKFVTLGGMIAADVHGKNHHCDGSFGKVVDWIDVMGPQGDILRALPGDDLFRWTLGGMGLTGVILRAAFRLRQVETGWIRQRTLPTANLSETLAAFEAHHDSPYSVAWIDSMSRGAALGRSLITLGAHAVLDDLTQSQQRTPFATPARRTLRMPLDAPGFLLNRHTVRAFNWAYFQRGLASAGESLLGWDSYFYPLDSVLGWNRVYGRKGFVQFQCALPLATSTAGLTQLLEAISLAGLGSFLAVLKRLGPESGGMSFPMEGHTLALDFPNTPATMALLGDLDRITLAHGGRFYLAKDSRLTPDMLRKTDPRAANFRNMREALALPGPFSSTQSERLFL
jgi:FAD/FMN-containing dehydrogenase